MALDTQSTTRRSKRKPAQITVTLVIDGDEAEYLATALDFSQHGLRLRSDIPLVPGQPVGLILNPHPDFFIGARVVWVGRTDSAEAGQAGLEFLAPLNDPVC